MISRADFENDHYGRKFADVLNDSRIDFNEAIDFFNNDARQIRLIDSEEHHDRPAFAGTVVEFEEHPTFKAFLSNYDAHSTQRFRQAIGVLVKLHMESMGYRTTGRKGALGTRKFVPSGTTKPGAYVNKHGLAKWFTKAERFVKNK